MRFRLYLLGIGSFLFLAAASSLLFSDRIIAAILTKKYNLDIKYSQCSKHFSGEFDFSGLSILSRPTGLGFIAKSAVIKPSIFNKKLAINFDLRNVNFIKRKNDEPAHYDTLTALVSSPFNSNWRYNRIYGSADPEKDGVTIKQLEASSDNIRLSLKGRAAYAGAIESDITIYFTTTFTSRIPPDLAKVILSDEKDGWKSLSVKLSGNVWKPSIQVQGKLFRLCIKEVKSANSL